MNDMNTIFEEADPVVKHRGVHLDLKGLQPTANRLLALLELFAAARYTFVLVEYVRTRVQPFRDELAALNKEFADLGEPKVNGHMQVWN